MTSYSKSPLVAANDVIAVNGNANTTIKNANRMDKDFFIVSSPIIWSIYFIIFLKIFV